MTKRYTSLGKDKRMRADIRTEIAEALANDASLVNDAVEALVSAGGGGGGGASFYSASYTGFAANDADGWLSIFKAPVAGSMTAVYFMPAFAIPGHDTDRRDIEIYRASPTGTFGSRAAHHDFTAEAGAFAHNQVTLALSATPADLALSAGDYALFKSDTNGAGAADVIGLVVIEFTPD